MKIDSSLSKWFLAFLMLFGAHTAQAEDIETMMLIANWKELAKMRTQKAAKQIYEEAMAQTTSKMMEDDMESAAALLFKAAEYCRDLNDVKHAITLFELVIELDPENPHYRRVYGDYLIGYRGLEEQAWAQLNKAKQLAKRYPEKVDSEFEATLNRSIHIFRRDTRNGPLGYERYQSDGALIFENEGFVITGGLDTIFSKRAKDPLDLSTDYFRAKDTLNSQIQDTIADDLRLENLLTVNGGTVGSRDELLDVGTLPDGSPITINNLQARNERVRESAQSYLDNLDREIERQLKSVETFLSLLLRTPYANLPSVRLSYLNTYSFDSSTNLEDLDNPYDRVSDAFAMEIEKTIILRNDLFLEGDIAVVHENVQIRNDQLVEDDSFLYLIGAANFKKEWGTRDGTVQLNVGGQYRRDLFDFEAYPIHQQKVSLSNFSFLKDPSENEERQRFRGRRISRQEIGVVRDERRYESEDRPTVIEENWRFFVSNEELGYLDNKLDIYTTYSYRERNLSDGIGEGSYSIHEFRVEPQWVPVFDLYKNDFVDGWEFVTVGFPMTANTDEGPYDRFTGGITFRGQYVISQAKLSVGFNLGIEYAHYTEADQEDLGGFIRFSIF